MIIGYMAIALLVMAVMTPVLLLLFWITVTIAEAIRRRRTARQQ
ncbi:MAG TPA: hypothetical protein VEG60_20020 [Candidatus Binatia bacterium]|nr:hypothetical protein [Candidatus Binatia bacterium]